MAHVTIERIAVVQADIATAITRTTSGSTLSQEEQDHLLAQSCAEACDLLNDWVHDAWWDRNLSSGDKTVKELLPAHKEFAEFLGPGLKDVLDRAKRNDVEVRDSTVDDAYTAVVATVRRFPRMKHKDLFETAHRRVIALQTEVCTLATEVRGGKKPEPAWRRRAAKALKAVRGSLLAITLALLATGPAAMAHNAANWGEPAVHAAEVIAVHYVAAQAQPGLAVSPPHAGPRVR